MISGPHISLPPWPNEFADKWIVFSDRAKKLTSRAGTGARFEAVLDEVRDHIDQQAWETLLGRLSSRTYARALTTVWMEDAVRAQASLTELTLERLAQAQLPKVSRMSTSALIAAYLNYFDTLDEWVPGLRGVMASTVQLTVAQQKPRDAFPDILDSIRDSPEHFIHRESPTWLAKYLVNQKVSLTEYFREAGLTGLDAGRFGSQVRDALYIEQIRAADPQVEHDFLIEIGAKNVFEAPGPNGLFGHALLHELISRPVEPPSEQWLDTVLSIAGDPRLKSAPSYLQWWRGVPDHLEQRVISWLSAEDLRLFLMAVEAFGEEDGIDNLQRLFPARKRFLRGLYDTGLVKETRLILGRNAKAYVRRHLGKTIRSDIGSYESGHDTAVIYLDCGDFHIVEGSHHFRMWVYLGQPDEALASRGHRTFSRNDFIHFIPDRHARANSLGREGYEAFTHQGFWQRKPIQFLADNRIPLKIEALMSDSDYYDYKHKHGLPAVRA